ncbi:MAG: hypothetical protein EOM76_07180 [Sphingobacteriia bacterium]|nr:hypothetical protein [Sphingobacteriia bacterium]
MYSIQNGTIFDNGTDTGVKAVYTKAEIATMYGWSSEVCRIRLNTISHMIYPIVKGKYKRNKRVFTPIEVTKIINEFGLP